MNIKELIKNNDLNNIKAIPVEKLLKLLKTEFKSDGSRTYPMHYAAKRGNLLIIQYFLQKDPSLYNQKDREDCPPFIWAKVCNHTQVAHFLAHFNPAQPLTANNTNPIKSAIANYDYETAVELLANLDKSIVLPLIESGKDALELMTLDPSLAKLFLADEQIASFIKETIGCVVKDNAIEWYKLAGRRGSFYSLINLENETVSVFTETKKLGEGGNGIVRLFENQQHEQLAVKSFKREIKLHPGQNESNLCEDLKTEVMFNDELYPNPIASRLYDYKYNRPSSTHEYYDMRLVRPYFKGENVLKFVESIKSDLDLAKLILKIIAELNRIHSHGVLHGDLNLKNILVLPLLDSFSIKFIDFACSYRLTDPSAYLWNNPAFFAPSDKPINRQWYAPEVWGMDKKSVKPDTSQDVYSIGYSLDVLLMHYEVDNEFELRFPSILDFIKTSQYEDPSKRPTLTDFHQKLLSEIELTIENEITKSNNNNNNNNDDGYNNPQIKNQQESTNAKKTTTKGPVAAIQNHGIWSKSTKRKTTTTSENKHKESCSLQ